MLRKLLACLLLATPLAAQPAGPKLLLQAPSTGPAMLGMNLDLKALAPVYPGAPLNPKDLLAASAQGNTCTPLPTQFDALPDGQGLLTVAAPEGAGSLVLFLRPSGLTAPPLPATALRVTRDGDKLTIENGTYAVSHDPAKLAGLPSRIELRPSGKVFSTYALNDRVYDHGAKLGFALRNDKQPKVELLAAGPLRAVVRVTARYLNEQGQAPASQPSAVYTFSYVAGSPVVQVDADIRQATPFDWSEFHLLEINFPDASFPGWVGGDPFTEGMFEAEKKGWTKSWGALRDGDSLVGLVGPGDARFYDGRGEYGTYLHGQWGTWSGLTARHTAGLFLSGAPDSLAALRQRTAAWRPLRLATAVPDVTADRLAAVRGGLTRLPAGTAGRIRWWLATVEAMARQGRYAPANALAGEIQAAVPQLARQSAAGLDAWLDQRTGWTTLSSGQVGAAFAGGQLVSLYDMAADRELLAQPAPLWELQLRDAQKNPLTFGPAIWAARQAGGEPLPGKVVSRRAPGELTLRYEGYPVFSGAATVPGPTATLRVRLAGPRLGLHLTVDNRTPLSLMRIACPLVPLGALGADSTDDTFLFPRGSGELQADPVGTAVSWDGGYPSGWCTMQFQAVYDPQGGVYLAAEDPYASTKSMMAHGPDGNGVVRHEVQWPAPDMTKAGNGWDEPGEAVIELFRGDWFDAAQIYRRWAEREALWWPARVKERTTPARFRDLDIWAQTGATPYEPDQVVPRTIAFADYMAVPTALHWYSWHQIPFDTFYPHYDPPRPRVAEGTAEMQRAGVLVMPYINGRLWDTELEDFKAEGKDAATSDEDGKPFIEIYGSKRPDGSPVKLAAMCPTTKLWQDKQRQIVLWLQNTIGVDGVYLDQIAAAGPHPCMNPAHGHPLGGGHWWTTDGYWPLLRKIRAEMKPGKFLTTECNAEPYMHLIDGYLTWHWQYAKQVPVFSAVYADQVTLFSRAYRGGPTADLANRMKAAQSLCFGEQLGWLTPDIIKTPAGAYLRTCAQIRHGLHDYLVGGRMLRVPALDGDIPKLTADWQWSGEWPVTLPAVQTAAWRAPDGRVALLFANFSPNPVTARFRLSAQDYGLPTAHATRRTTTGATAAGTWRAGEAQTLTIPAEDVVAYELSKG